MPADESSAPPDELEGNRSAPLAGLVLVSTPIGNLSDLSDRARATFAACDIILCEDTRRTGRLLSAAGIRARTEPLHEHNEDARIPGIIARLQQGQVICLVSDAGTPLVSDPGFRLVRAAIADDIPVTAIPGPNAAVTALVLSGLPPLPFMFLGFPPPKQAARRAAFGSLRAAEHAGLSATLIWHEAPHRLSETLVDLREVFGDRPAAVARELTKRFETVLRGSLSSIEAAFVSELPRGEITLLIGPPNEDDGRVELDDQLHKALINSSIKDAAALVSAATGLPRKIVYARALELAQKT